MPKPRILCKAALAEIEQQVNTQLENQAENFVTINEAAAILRLSHHTVRHLLARKKLRRFKVGGVGAGRRTLLHKDDVLALVRVEEVES